MEYVLDDYCLKVKLGVSGCDDNHSFELVADKEATSYDPLIVHFDFYDYNPQSCEAYFELYREFDLEPIKFRFSNIEKISCSFQTKGFLISRGTKIRVMQGIMRIFETKNKSERLASNV